MLRRISPYVYGINSQPAEGAGATVRRMGGNRQTAYNWELNASNAGSDYNHSSDGWACTVLGYHDCDVPGAQFLDFALANREAGLETVATVPMVDYVTADKRGSVLEADKAPEQAVEQIGRPEARPLRRRRPISATASSMRTSS